MPPVLALGLLSSFPRAAFLGLGTRTCRSAIPGSQREDDAAEALLPCREGGRGWHWAVRKEKRQKKDKTRPGFAFPRHGGEEGTHPALLASRCPRRAERGGEVPWKG